MLEAVAQIAVLVFVVSCMLTAGLGLRFVEVLVTVRRPGLSTRVLIANFAISPLLAYALAQVFPAESPCAVALVLLGVAAGAPFLPKLAALARGDVAFSIGLMLVLTLGSVAFVPLALPWLVPGLSANWWAILRPLLITMLLPLGIAMVVRSRSDHWANRLRRLFGPVSNASLVLALVLMVGLNLGSMLDTIGSGAIAIAGLYVTLCYAAGYALGGPAQPTRAVLGLGTGQRNIAAALVVATQNGNDPGVIAMLLVATLVGVAVLVVAARWSARHSPNPPAQPTEHDPQASPLAPAIKLDLFSRPKEMTP